jgi:hypothetical protein
MKLFLPDACWQKDLISGAVFLYFHRDSVGFTLHPSVSTFMTGTDPFDFFQLVDERKPSWAPKFFQFVEYWRAYRASLHETSKLLEPLRGIIWKSIWLIYPRGADAWESATELLLSSALPKPEIVQSIDPFSASDELFVHIFFEQYLQLYYPDHSPQELMALGKELAAAPHDRSPVVVDWGKLYEYCGKLFGATDLEWLLATSYMFRMPLLERRDAILLSNEGLAPFLSSLPVEPTPAPGTKPAEEVLDVAAWEFFRQLVSPIVDPLNDHRIQKLSQLIRTRADEIEQLRTRCLRLAQELGTEADLHLLQSRISNHIRINVQKDIQAVLDVDNRAVNDLLTTVFSDEKTWLSIATFLYSLLHGGEVLTAGSAIYAFANLGSRAFKAAADRKEKLRASDYTLLYRMKKR